MEMQKLKKLVSSGDKISLDTAWDEVSSVWQESNAIYASIDYSMYDDEYIHNQLQGLVIPTIKLLIDSANRDDQQVSYSVNELEDVYTRANIFVKELDIDWCQQQLSSRNKEIDNQGKSKLSRASKIKPPNISPKEKKRLKAIRVVWNNLVNKKKWRGANDNKKSLLFNTLNKEIYVPLNTLRKQYNNNQIQLTDRQIKWIEDKLEEVKNFRECMKKVKN